jgi:hypothetical protein
MRNPKSLSLDQMRAAAGVGPEWEVIWMSAERVDVLQHLCACIYGPGGTYRSEWVRVPYAATGTPGVQAAKCERCRVAWVRASRIHPSSGKE